MSAGTPGGCRRERFVSKELKNAKQRSGVCNTGKAYLRAQPKVRSTARFQLP